MLKYAVIVSIAALLGLAGYFFWSGLKARDALELSETKNGPPVLHVIGVYEGESKARTRQRDEQDECIAGAIGNPREIEEKGVNVGAIQKCRKNDQRAEGIIDVEITDRSGPIVLGMTAYEPMLWRVSVGRGVKIKEVILGGHHAQRVEGVDADTSIDLYTYESSPTCARCEQHPDHFYSYEAVPEELRRLTRMAPTSFQGSYRGKRFTISEHTGRSQD